MCEDGSRVESGVKNKDCKICIFCGLIKGHKIMSRTNICTLLLQMLHMTAIEKNLSTDRHKNLDTI